MLLALSDVTYDLIGWFKFLLLKFLYEYGPRIGSWTVSTALPVGLRPTLEWARTCYQSITVNIPESEVEGDLDGV